MDVCLYTKYADSVYSFLTWIKIIKNEADAGLLLIDNCVEIKQKLTWAELKFNIGMSW